MPPALMIKNRTVLKLSGPERVDFLNGLVTNSVETADGTKAVYAGLLTPQGKYLFDMLIRADADSLWLDVDKGRAPDLHRRLMMYKLRADVSIEDKSTTHKVFALKNESDAPLAYADPRSTSLGWRVIAESDPEAEGWNEDDYEVARLKAGVPDGPRDIEVEKYFWPETNAEALNGTSYTKGCYVGQELVSRLKHRTEVKRLILPAAIAGGAPKHGTDILSGDGKRAGTVLTSAGADALVYLRIEYRDGPLSAEGREVTLIP